MRTLVSTVIESFGAHQIMINQVLDSERVQNGLLDILLGHGGLWEALRERGE